MITRRFFDVPQPWKNETGSRQTLHNNTARTRGDRLCGLDWRIDHLPGRRVTTPNLERRREGLSFDKQAECVRQTTLRASEAQRKPIIGQRTRTECRGGWPTKRVPDKVFMNPSLGTTRYDLVDNDTNYIQQ